MTAKGDAMTTGTIVCAINESTGAARALRAASRLAERLDMRLVAVHVVEDAPLSPAARRGARAGGLRLVDRVLAEQGVAVADRRVAIGDPAEHIGRIAREERAELIVVGSTPHGRRHRPPLRSRLATELPRVTPVPVVVVPPQVGRPYATASSSLFPDGSVSTRPAAVSSPPAPAAAARPSTRSSSSASGRTIVA
jgi:nucleotide-binding universal stress UspA family protein